MGHTNVLREFHDHFKLKEALVVNRNTTIRLRDDGFDDLVFLIEKKWITPYFLFGEHVSYDTEKLFERLMLWFIEQDNITIKDTNLPYLMMKSAMMNEYGGSITALFDKGN